MKKYYTNGEVTVLWQPDKCTHSGMCARGLSSVFKPKQVPWVDMSGASSEEIVAQVTKCPSGALSIVENQEGVD